MKECGATANLDTYLSEVNIWSSGRRFNDIILEMYQKF